MEGMKGMISFSIHSSYPNPLTLIIIWALFILMLFNPDGIETKEGLFIKLKRLEGYAWTDRTNIRWSESLVIYAPSVHLVYHLHTHHVSIYPVSNSHISYLRFIYDMRLE